MKKIITAIVFSLTIFTLFAQKNEYFGSAIIPKNEYFVKAKGHDLYWKSTNKEGEKVLEASFSDNASARLMFIPAGNGYYFIKFLQNGHYLNTDQPGENTPLNTRPPKRNDNQKFKVVSMGNGLFKFITTNNLAVDGNSSNKNAGIHLGKDNGNESQRFEIIEAATKKKFTGN